MQAFNKYYPEDWTPEQGSANTFQGTHALGKRARKLDQGVLITRFELPFNIWCTSCNKPIGMGVRYNAEKKKVGMYHTTPIWSFKCKCHLCQNWFEIQTDPKNARYVVISGARQKVEDWDPAENGGYVIEENVGGDADGPVDAFAAVERTETQKTKAKKDQERIEKLQEHQERNWSDPYERSVALRKTFRSEKRNLNIAGAKASHLRERYGLGSSLPTDLLNTPALGSAAHREEEDEWRAARKDKRRLPSTAPPSILAQGITKKPALELAARLSRSKNRASGANSHSSSELSAKQRLLNNLTRKRS